MNNNHPLRAGIITLALTVAYGGALVSFPKPADARGADSQKASTATAAQPTPLFLASIGTIKGGAGMRCPDSCPSEDDPEYDVECYCQ